jgi:hypothetical protein
MKSALFAKAGLFLISGLAQAEDSLSQASLSEVALFNRCYSHLTRLRLPKSHPLLTQVKLGSKTAAQACAETLSKAQLGEDGRPVASSDPESIAILNNFYQFHRLWFDNADFTENPITYSQSQILHNDITEPALYVTRVLFHASAPYSEVVTGNYSVRGLRSSGAHKFDYNGSAGVFWVPITHAAAGLQRGSLQGITSYAPGNKTWLTHSGQSVTNLDANFTGGQSFTANRSYGGGVMGLHSYLFMNSGFPNIGSSDGAATSPESRSSVSNASIRMHRRWSKAVMHDFLCRNVPVLRIEDVNDLVVAYIQAVPDSTKRIAFRESTNCMSCHAALDPMAGTARSFHFVRHDATDWLGLGVSGDTRNRATFVRSQPVTMPPEAVKEQSLMLRDSDYWKRPATGALRYRSYDGEKVWTDIVATGNLDGIEKLGAAMASTKDLYVCAASRYFEFFTGISVNLLDEGDPRYPPMSASDKYYREMVIRLGTKLKTHQSLRQLIQEIMESEIYRKLGTRDVAP